MKLTKLNKEQIKRKKEIKDFWIKTALYSGDEIDKVEAEKGIKYLYKKCKLKELKVVFLSSPLSVQYFANVIGKVKKQNEVENEVNEEGSEGRSEE